MTQTVVRLPQTDISGLSENWLLRHCGEEHWKRLCSAMGIVGVSHELLRDRSKRALYPAFIAVRARYGSPLSTVSLYERFSTTFELARFGTELFQGTARFQNERTCFEVEMLTTFVRRVEQGQNKLQPAYPDVQHRRDITALSAVPPLLRLSRRLRHSELITYDFMGYSIPLGNTTPGLPYEPSPYVDYNRAGLLYFASYPTIADTIERQAFRTKSDQSDWALRSSTLARDIYYYGNLEVGDRLVVNVKRFQRDESTTVLHALLRNEESGSSIGEIFTAKKIVSH